MDYLKFMVSNQKGEYISIQKDKHVQSISIGRLIEQNAYIDQLLNIWTYICTTT